MENRRNFLKQIVCAAVMTASPSLIQATPATRKAKKIKLKKGATLLFQGDSITDAGRGNTNGSANDIWGFGRGYAFIAASSLMNRYPQLELKTYNRGISGNKVYQLQERWAKDCLEMKPDVLSILIGVNDYWHMYTKQYDGTVEKYEKDYRQLLKDTKAALPEVQLIVLEPYALRDTSAVKDDWFPAFDAYRAVAAKLANEFDAAFIPLQSIFEEAVKYAPANYWAYDGVHPSMAGAALIAEAYCQLLGK